MECQEVVEALSSYIDGELEAYEVSALEMHLDYCGVCREQWQQLLSVTSLVQSMPEEVPQTEFHSDLLSRLTKLSPVAVQSVVLPDFDSEQCYNIPEYKRSMRSIQRDTQSEFDDLPIVNNSQEEKVRRKAAKRRSLWGGQWLRFASVAAVLVMAFGVTALWYPNLLVSKNQPVAQVQSSPIKDTSANQVVIDEVSKPTSSSKGSIAQTDKITKEPASVTKTQSKVAELSLIKPAGQANQQKLQAEKTTKNATKDTAGKNSVASKKSSAGVVTAGKAINVASASPLAKSKEGKVTTSPNNPTLKATAGGGVEVAAPMISNNQLRSKSVQMKVENNSNTTAQILILSKDENATAKVENNKISIAVPTENYDALVKQIESMGDANSPKAIINNTAQVIENKSLIVQIEERKSGN